MADKTMLTKLILDASSYKQGIDMAKQATTTINKELELWKVQNNAVNGSLKTLSQQAKANADTQKILSAEIDLTKQKLKEIIDAKGAASKEAMAYQNKLLDLEIQQAKLSKEIGGGLTPLQNFKNGMKETGEQLQKIGDKMQSVGKNMSMYITAPIVAAGAGIAKLVGSAVKYADEIGVMAEKTGMSVESLQQMRYVTNQLDMEFSSVQTSISAFTNKMKGADSDTGAFTETLRKLHVKVKDNGQFKDMSALYSEIIDKLSVMTNEVERNVMMTALFGRGWMDIVPMVNAGKEELIKLREEASKMGVLTASEIEELRILGDAWDKIKMQIELVGLRIAVNLAPVITGSLIPALENVITFLTPILDIIKKMNPQTMIFIAAFAGIIAVIGPLIYLVGGLTTAVGGIAAAFGVMNLTGMKTALIVGSVVLALVALAAVIAIIIGRGAEMRNTAASIANSVKGISNPGQTSGYQTGHNASGTNNWRGGLTWINENGGEIIDAPNGTRIIPHDVSMEMAKNRNITNGSSGSKQVVINFNGPVYGVLDFEQRVKQIVRDAGAAGAFRGVFQNV